MSWTEGGAPKSRAELRRFGYVMAGGFAFFAAIAWWRESGLLPYLIGIATAFALLALVAPALLRRVEIVWMRFALVLGTIMTHVLLTVVFYLVITPIGLVKRLVSGDSLGKKPDPSLQTYWVTIAPDGPASRPDKPF